jgi:adenylate cyclase
MAGREADPLEESLMRSWNSRLSAQIVELGTQGYPPHIRRRLKILNVMGYLIAIFSLIYAVSYSLEKAEGYGWIIAINLALVVMGLSVPLLHRVHEVMGGMVIAVTECAALFGLVAMLGRDSGIQLNLIIGAAAAFFILGLERLILCIALVTVCFLLNVAAWLLFPQGVVPVTPAFLDQLYISSAVTVFAITALLVYYAFRLAERAEAETEALLRNILPEQIVDRLRQHPEEAIAEAVDEASILFSDIQGFVSLSKRLGAERTVAMLNDIMRRFDALAVKHGVEKIKTIGDAYMAVAGLPQPVPDHAARLARMALDMLKEKAAVADHFGVTIRMRVGLASGPVMAGIIGTKKFSYDVWGDAVNLASRLESTGEPERIQVSAEAHVAMARSFDCEARGEIEIKGLGPTETWFLVAPRADPAVPAAAS